MLHNGTLPLAEGDDPTWRGLEAPGVRVGTDVPGRTVVIGLGVPGQPVAFGMLSTARATHRGPVTVRGSVSFPQAGSGRSAFMNVSHAT